MLCNNYDSMYHNLVPMNKVFTFNDSRGKYKQIAIKILVIFKVSKTVMLRSFRMNIFIVNKLEAGTVCFW